MTAAAPPLSLDDLETLRRTEFPLASRHVFFNHASDSPMPARTAALMAERVAVLQDPPRETGQREGYAAAARRRIGAVTRMAPKRDGRTDPALIAAAITPRTRVLAISDVEYQDGFRNDLAALGALCRERGILFVVDASQSLGSVPCDARAWRADVVMAVGYKWLMGMHGIGVLAVDEAAMERIRPSTPGRLAVSAPVETEDYELSWHADARRYQSGAPNWLGILALAESAGLVEELGFEACAAHSRAVTDLLADGLRERGLAVVSDLDPARRSHILAFTTGSIAGDEALAGRFAERDVILSLRGRGLRASAHFWNTAGDVARLLAAIG